MAEMRKVQCPDCHTVCEYSFVLAAHDGKKTALMLVASCSICREEGDDRSLRNFEKVEKDMLSYALDNKLPVVLLQ